MNENVNDEENINDDKNITNNENIEDSENDINKESKEPKKIEVVTGDGDLNISPVSRYIEVEKPRPKENREIVVPKVKEPIPNKSNSNNGEN